ncbi:MAG: nucleotidyltransferase family protein [Thermodesulfobacteriota bacterium]|nr:nucleotidyltransferase family protein [Thermodesulfobacteriota bacterium]
MIDFLKILPPLYDLLCRAATGIEHNQIARTYARIGDTALWNAAKANRIAPIVAHTLTDVLGAENIPSHWQEAHHETHRRISAYLTELDRIAKQFAEKGIQLVALKNGGIAHGIYPCPGCCPMGDLDVLVEKNYFKDAHRVLIENGYHLESRSPIEEPTVEAAEKSGGAEYCKFLRDGEKLWFELQWRPVAGRWIRPDQEPAVKDLMSRSVPIPDSAVRLLSAEDNLLQVALHTAKHSYVRAPGLRLHLDVNRIVRYHGVDWDMFLQRAFDLKVKTAVFFSLAIPATLFQSPIPDEVLTQLEPHAWKRNRITRSLQNAGLFNPDERKFSRIGFIIFTALLYDDLRGLWRSIFPDKVWIREQYGTKEDQGLPGLYLKRLIDLTFRRVST